MIVLHAVPSLPLTRLGRATSLGETPREKRAHSLSMSEMDKPHVDHHLKSSDNEAAAAQWIGLSNVSNES